MNTLFSIPALKSLSGVVGDLISKAISLGAYSSLLLSNRQCDWMESCIEEGFICPDP